MTSSEISDSKELSVFKLPIRFPGCNGVGVPSPHGHGRDGPSPVEGVLRHGVVIGGVGLSRDVGRGLSLEVDQGHVQLGLLLLSFS